MIVELAGLPAARIGAAVQREWGVEVTHAEHAGVGAGAWHWRVGDDGGTTWFATVDVVRTAEERVARLNAYEAAAQLGHLLPFVVAPVRTRDARVAVDVGHGLLLSLTRFLEGDSGVGAFADDAERAEVARLLGDLHGQPRPRQLPVWRPRIGRSPRAQRADLERCLAQPDWSGGPWSGPASRLLQWARAVIEAAIARFAVLGAAVVGTAERWVVTHGEPHTANVLSTPDGPRLVDWDTIALAPRERDLREVLGEADGHDPWLAYVEGGGRPLPLSPDTVELFTLDWHLAEVVEYAVRFSSPHEDDADDSRCFSDLEAEIAALVAGWA